MSIQDRIAQSFAKTSQQSATVAGGTPDSPATPARPKPSDLVKVVRPLRDGLDYFAESRWPVVRDTLVSGAMSASQLHKHVGGDLGRLRKTLSYLVEQGRLTCATCVSKTGHKAVFYSLVEE
jgi:hypothetical protein